MPARREGVFSQIITGLSQKTPILTLKVAILVHQPAGKLSHFDRPCTDNIVRLFMLNRKYFNAFIHTCQMHFNLNSMTCRCVYYRMFTVWLSRK